METHDTLDLTRRGHERLVVWQNAARLRKMVYDISSRFPREEMRRVSQMQDAARSVKQNIQEGYARYSIGEYIHALNIAKGSVGELIGDVNDCFEDRLITFQQYKILEELCGKTEYLLKRLMQSLRQKQLEKTWVKY